MISLSCDLKLEFMNIKLIKLVQMGCCVDSSESVDVFEKRRESFCLGFPFFFFQYLPFLFSLLSSFDFFFCFLKEKEILI